MVLWERAVVAEPAKEHHDIFPFVVPCNNRVRERRMWQICGVSMKVSTVGQVVAEIER